MNQDRLPPFAHEAEQGILGCLMLDPAQIVPLAVETFGRPTEAFYDLRHTIVFDSILELWDKRAPIDVISLQQHLKDRNQLEQIGGITYLSSLPDTTPSTANAPYYIELIEEKRVLRKLIQACAGIVSRIYDSELDVESIVSHAEQEMLAVRRNRPSKAFLVRDLVQEAISEFERLYANSGSISGISTGFVDLDYLTDGLHSSEVIVIAGYPGSGKSAIAMNIAEHVAVEMKQPVGVFSLEMSANKLVGRMIAARGRVNLRSIRNGSLSEKDFVKITSAASKIASSNLHFSEIPDMTIHQLRAKARQMQSQHGIRLIVVDYLQLLTCPGRKDQSREQEVSAISRGVKLMAKELNIPVIVLSQLNDDGKLRESRAIGQDADTVWVLNADKDKEGDCIPVALEIRKQRDGQAPAKVDLTFMKAFTKFENAARITH